MARPDPIDPLEQLNRSGFPLQLGIEHAINSGTREHGWFVASREHPWTATTTGVPRFIDLVLRHESIDVLRLVLECKRMKTQHGNAVRWLFLQPVDGTSDERRASSFQLERCFNPAAPSGWNEQRAWDDVYITPTSAQSEFCIMVGDDAGRAPLLEALAAEGLAAAEGLGDEEVQVSLSHQARHLRIFIFAVIVTNAELTVCRFDPANVQLHDGCLDAANTTFLSVPFVRFRKSVRANFPAGVHHDLRSAAMAREQTVFVVNAGRISEFLTGWSLSPLDAFQGFAIQRSSLG